MLPPAYRWADTDTGSVLYLRYGAVATVAADGRVKLLGARPIESQAASRAQGKRFVERWIAANGPLPSGRVLEMRARLRLDQRHRT